MKHLMTLVALLVSTAAVAQIPTLPWNPDGNDDQFIGLPDLLDLLTVYGEEFENAIVAEDGESAIMYMGDMGYPQCQYACENLPGFWTMPKLQDLVPVWEDVSGVDDTYTWLTREAYPNLDNPLPYYNGSPNSNERYRIQSSVRVDYAYSCYCTAKQLPRVEYDICAYQNLSDFLPCCEQKTSEGWYPLDGRVYDYGSSYGFSQAFWRFAQ